MFGRPTWRDFLHLHHSLDIPFYVKRPRLSLCGVSEINMEPQSIFEHLGPRWKPMATKSRHHSSHDSIFIDEELREMIHEGIIEPLESSLEGTGTRYNK